jgi:capsular polysaccharide biosynthesis protein
MGTYDPYDDSSTDEDWPVEAPTGLVSLAFLKAAIRRSASFCYLFALIGLLIGCAFYKEFPAPYKATTSVLVTYGPYEGGAGASLDNQAIAQTRSVATLAIHTLGLHQDPNSFLNMYKVTVVGNRLLQVTFTAPSASEAVHGANAVASAFLQLRAGQLNHAQEQMAASLKQQISQAQQNVNSIKTQISEVSAQPSSAAQQSQLTSLQGQLTSANTALTNLQQAFNVNQATNAPATGAAIKGSQVLDTGALLPRSHLRSLVLYPGAGLIAGAAAGIAIVIIRAILSDRVRRRNEVADALGTSVKLSTGPLRRNWRLMISRRRRADREARIRRVAAHFAGAMPENVGGAAALAVVAVDDPEASALPVVSFATSCAEQGQGVVLADLTDGACAARMLGVDQPGVGVVEGVHARLTVALPEPDDVTPTGPLAHMPAGHPSPFAEAVSAACAEADVLLTVVSLHPWLGGEHLPSWATDAVAIVTAGRSSWTRINAVGEMIRLSGTRLVSAVLIGSDTTDESLGLVPAQHFGDGDLVHDPSSHGQVVKLTADESEGRPRLMRSDALHQ